MTLEEIIEEIKLELSGGVLELEISDQQIAQVVKKATRELERYWDETTMVTIPFASCIDLTSSELDLKEKVVAITNVFRTEAYGGDRQNGGLIDPMFAQQYMLYSSGGTMYNLNDYVLNYASWNTLLQIKNTISTDLDFTEDRHNNKLYINEYMDTPARITVEYIPKINDVTNIKSDYWIDILVRLSIALTKVILGRIRSRFTQSSALWTQDGEAMLSEGNTELQALRERLLSNENLILPRD